MAFGHSSLEPALYEMTPTTISSGLVPNPPSLTLFVPPSRTDLDLLFYLLFDELLNPPPSVDFPSPKVIAPIAEVVAPEPTASTGSPSSITFDQDAPSPSNSQTTPETQTPVISNDVEEDNHDLDVAHMKLKNFKQAMIKPSWIDAIQEEIHKFKRLQVWELVPCPDKVLLIKLKWIYKIKTNELGGVLKNKARLVAQGFRQEEYFESTDDEAYDDVTQGVNVKEEKLDDDKINEQEVDELYYDGNINLEGRDTKMTDVSLINVQATYVVEDTHVLMTVVTPEVQHKSSSVSLGFIFNMLNPNPNIAISLIPGFVDKYLDNRMNEAVKVAVQLQSNRLREEAQANNEDFINKLDENIKKIIKDQVKVQVKEQVTKILPRIKKLVNEQLEAEVLTRSSYEANTYHAVAANLSELELKKILIEKTELILDTYGDTVTIKRHRDDKDNDEEPSDGLNRGSKRRRDGKEPVSISKPKEKTSKSTGKSKESSNVRSANNFGVRVSNFTLFIMNAEKPREQAKSCFNHDQELEVLLVSKTNQDTERPLQQDEVSATDILEECRQGKNRSYDHNKIDKQLKNRRIMMSLEIFVGGRPYKGDFQIVKRTI
nr:Gag-Pol polyprotein [Tanacetum cinerariifolium]